MGCCGIKVHNNCWECVTAVRVTERKHQCQAINRLRKQCMFIHNFLHEGSNARRKCGWRREREGRKERGKEVGRVEEGMEREWKVQVRA